MLIRAIPLAPGGCSKPPCCAACLRDASHPPVMSSSRCPHEHKPSGLLLNDDKCQMLSTSWQQAEARGASFTAAHSTSSSSSPVGAVGEKLPADSSQKRTGPWLAGALLHPSPMRVHLHPCFIFSAGCCSCCSAFHGMFASWQTRFVRECFSSQALHCIC